MYDDEKDDANRLSLDISHKWKIANLCLNAQGRRR